MMFKKIIAMAMVAVVAAKDDEPEAPKAETFADVVQKLPSIHFTSMPGPLQPGVYKLMMDSLPSELGQVTQE